MGDSYGDELSSIHPFFKYSFICILASCNSKGLILHMSLKDGFLYSSREIIWIISRCGGNPLGKGSNTSTNSSNNIEEGSVIMSFTSSPTTINCTRNKITLFRIDRFNCMVVILWGFGLWFCIGFTSQSFNDGPYKAHNIHIENPRVPCTRLDFTSQLLPNIMSILLSMLRPSVICVHSSQLVHRCATLG